MGCLLSSSNDVHHPDTCMTQASENARTPRRCCAARRCCTRAPSCRCGASRTMCRRCSPSSFVSAPSSRPSSVNLSAHAFQFCFIPVGFALSQHLLSTVHLRMRCLTGAHAGSPCGCLPGCRLRCCCVLHVRQCLLQVAAGLECGVGVADFAGWKEGDRLEVFSVEQKQRTLEEASAAG